MTSTTGDCLVKPASVTGIYDDNCAIGCLRRLGGICIEQDITVTGTGDLTANVFQWTGTVLVMRQWAELQSVTTLANATDVYADIWDGTTATKLTAGNPGGAVLSGAPVTSFFTKDKDDTEPYTVHLADQARVSEPAQKDVGYPFYITAKYGATNYIRFHLSTTDDPVSFVMKVHFTYRPMNGATLTFV